MINYFVEYWDCGNEQRNLEIINCINNNIHSKLFTNIFIFSSSKEDRIDHTIISNERITYQFIFNNSLDGVNILANSDIQFDESILLSQNIKDDEFYALTRYEDDGFRHKHDDPYFGSDSQDVWIWKNKCKISDANFYLGLPGCDNKIAYHAFQHGYEVTNPSLTIKTYHKHSTELRTGTTSDIIHRIDPPYALVYPSELIL